MPKKKNWAGIALLTIASLIALLPIWIMLCDSLKTGSELSVNSWGVPQTPTLANYVDLVSYNSGIMVRTFLNSVFISVVYTALTLLLSCLAAFAFAKYRFRGRNAIFMILVATMMVPGELTMPAIFLMFSKAKMLPTPRDTTFLPAAMPTGRKPCCPMPPAPCICRNAALKH